MRLLVLQNQAHSVSKIIQSYLINIVCKTIGLAWRDQSVWFMLVVTASQEAACILFLCQYKYSINCFHFDCSLSLIPSPLIYSEISFGSSPLWYLNDVSWHGKQLFSLPSLTERVSC
jgi:hypothetical protein